MGMLLVGAVFEELVKFMPLAFFKARSWTVFIMPVMLGFGEFFLYIFTKNTPMSDRIPALFLHLVTGVILYIASKYSWQIQIRSFVLNILIHVSFNLSIRFIL